MDERILIVSDDQRNAATRESLAQNGFSVTLGDDEQNGYRHLLESRFDLVIVNLSDAARGLGLIKQIRANSVLGKLLILAVADWGTGQLTMALSAGADGLEPAPIDPERLIASVTRMLRPNLTKTARASVTEQATE